MNNYKRILLIALAVISFNSCTDILETVPKDRISSTIFWKAEKDFEYAANAVYNYLESDWDFILWDAMSDIGHVTLQWRAESIHEKGAGDATMGIMENHWNQAYEGIQTANIFLDNAATFEADDQDLIDRLVAEVRTLRAYLYLELAFLFGDVPLLITETDIATSQSVSRTPVAQVWDFIDTELTAAAADLPTTQADVGRITKGAALGLKTRAMLYAGRYTDAAAAAQAVMNLGVYSIYPSFANLFSYQAENSAEVILDKQYIQDLASHRMYSNIVANSVWANQCDFNPTKECVDAFAMTNGLAIGDAGSGFDPYDPYTNRDPRLAATVYYIGSILPDGNVYDSRPNSGTGDGLGFAENTTATGFNAKKYLNPEDLDDPWNSGINLILLRYADVLLMYAEAKIELGQIDQSVLDAINEVRDRPDVNMPAITTMVQSELRDIVRNERICELAFEGLRYFDIRRWRIAETVMPGIIHGMTYVDATSGNLVDVDITGFEKFFRADRDYLWPIPHNEMLLNPNLTQNPNW